MTFVVTENCIRCRFMDCVDPCPVDCFHVGPDFLVINPEECIDCNLCAIECPVEAIYQDKDLPEDQKDFIEVNKELSKIWPLADGVADPLPDAEHWQDVSNKRELLSEASHIFSVSEEIG